MVILTEEQIADLKNEKQRLVMEYYDKMANSSNKIAEITVDAVRQGRLNIKGNASIIDKFKAAFTVEKGDFIKIPSKDMFKWSNDILRAQNQNFKTIMDKTEQGYNSILKDIDDEIAKRNSELEELKNQVEEIEKKLVNETDDKKADRLTRYKTGLERRHISHTKDTEPSAIN